MEDLSEKETTLSKPEDQLAEVVADGTGQAEQQPAMPTQELRRPTEVEVAEAASAPDATEASPKPEAETPVPSNTKETKPKEAAPAKPKGPRLSELRPGAIVEGKVTRIERYGAFVDLGLVEHRDGLIHISELAPYRIRRVEDVVKVGDSVKARVVSVDLNRNRIALSLNDVESEQFNTEAVPRTNEPMLTSMAIAFERAYGQRRERDAKAGNNTGRNDKGSKAKREHEMLMEKFRPNKK